MKNVIILCFALIFALTAMTVNASAQAVQTVPARAGAPNAEPISESEIALMRRDLRSEKKKLIALNVPLTEDEATKFWPIYDQYVTDMRKWNDEFYATISDYSQNGKNWTDAQASSMLEKWVKIQMEQAKTRQKFIPLIEKTIPPKKAALFFQIDRRLYVLMDLQVSTFLPLVTQ